MSSGEGGHGTVTDKFRSRASGLLPGPMVIAYLSLFATAGLAIKQIAYPLAAIASAGTFLPVSPLVSGVYMMWLVAGRAITRYRLAGSFIGLVQALVAFLLVFGRHGPFNIPLYVATGVTVDLMFMALGRFSSTMFGSVLINSAASLVGTVMVVWLELQMSRIVVIASALVSLGSGAIGGLLAYQLIELYASTLGKRLKFVDDGPSGPGKGRMVESARRLDRIKSLLQGGKAQ